MEKHKVAKLIEDIAQAVGMRVPDPQSSHRVYFEDQTSMSIESMRYSRGKLGLPSVMHEITITGTPDKADGTPGLKAAPFARFMCSFLNSALPVPIHPIALNAASDRIIRFEHDDPATEPSDVEYKLTQLHDKLLAPENKHHLESFRKLLALAQDIEYAFSDHIEEKENPKTATRVVPMFRFDNHETPILGLRIETNDQSLINRFGNLHSQGISDRKLKEAFPALLHGYPDTHYFQNGHLIKAEGPKALATVHAMMRQLLDFNKQAAEDSAVTPDSDLPPWRSASYGRG